MKKKCRTAVRCLPAVLAALFVLASSSCTGMKLSDEEAAQMKEVAANLMEKSGEINDILYGAGLPHEEEETPLTYDGSMEIVFDTEPGEETEEEDFEGGVKSAKYCLVVSPKYKNIDSIKEAASEVYLGSYLDNVVYPWVFEGVSSGHDIYQYARYIENYRGELCIRSDAPDDSYESGEVWDISSITVTGKVRGEVYFTIKTADGADEYSFSMLDEGAGWRLTGLTLVKKK
ncbi:MAG: hypothetical protein IJQ80_08735 [Clostridia bacterium]|nr:hypothetical protein [Clostridia bacterium]